jgi:hypothetical protein
VLEVKGGIDTAGVHERRGATLKSLVDAQQANPNSVRILILQGVSLTAAARKKQESDRPIVSHWFASEDILENEEIREQLFRLLGL